MVLITTVMAAVSAAALALAVAWLASRWDPGEMPDGLTAMIATITGFFMFSSAFLIITAVNGLSEARVATYAESGALREAYWAAGALPDAQKIRFRQGLRQYTENVVVSEWPRMNPSDVRKVPWDPLDELRASVVEDEERGNQSQALRAMDDRLRHVYETRRDRFAEASRGLPEPLLVLMVTLGTLSLLLASVTSSPRSPIHWFLLAVGAIVYGCVINLVLQLNYPLSGEVQIHPAAYEQALVRFHDIGL